MEIYELRFQAIREAQRFVTANHEQYSQTYEGPNGMAKTVVRIADFMLAYANGTHKAFMEENK